MQARGLEQKLNETFPPVNPTPYMNDREIMFQAGQRSVVEWIKQYMAENDV
tara:strand:- start:52 stop:204 length:153 start_codon:yes stop_codon:yes gene_type:complete